MTIYTKSMTFFTGAALSLIAVAVFSNTVYAAKGSGNGSGTVKDPYQARGTFPTLTNPGQCISRTNATLAANIQTQAVLRKSQGVWQFQMETVGSESEGLWKISFSDNGPLGVPQSISFIPPGGWTVVGGNIDQNQKGIHRLNGQATKIGSFIKDSTSVGIVCNVVIDLTV